MTAKDLKNALLQEAVQGKLVPLACRQAGKLQAKIPSAKDGQWFVYVIECEDGSFYKGFTTDLQKRYEQHCNGTGADWTKTHKPKQLYYWEIHYSEESALQREKYLKSGVGREWFKNEVVDKPENWSSARDLLEEIRRSRHSELVLESKNKTKKEKPLPEITEAEIPFDIPEYWCWCRLGEIVQLISGQDLQPEMYNSSKKGIPYITGASNFNNGQILINRWTENPKSIAIKDDLLLTCKGTVGEMAFLKEKQVHIARQVMSIRSSEKISLGYVKIYLTTQIESLKSKAKSMIPGIAREDVMSSLISLPPLAEQKRIVAAIEKFMPLLEEYGKKETELKAINEQIGALTKKAILQEAVQGKIVPQIAAEGNAKDLLEEIKKEKLSHGLDFANAKSGKRKSKKETALAGSNPCDISDDEIPFDIPESWCWCRLGEIVYNNGQKTPDKEFSYIDIGSIDNLHQKLNDKENFIQPGNAPSRARKIVKKGDIIYSTVRPYLHNICIIDKDFEKEPIASTGFAVLACYPQISNQYLFYYLLSPSFDNYANDTENSKGVAYPAINDDRLYKGIVPLPPLAEQKRIVTAIEKMLPLCEKLGE